MNYIALDFETANASRGSVCSIGLVEMQGGEIVREYYSLINPHDRFDPYCIAVHGITEAMVWDAPDFAQVWQEISGWLAGHTLVAHNAAFDMSVLAACLDIHQLEYPSCTYVCSYLLSRKIWPGLPGYKLNQMASFHGLSSFRHHDALEDARIAGLLLLKCFERTGAPDCLALAESCGYRIGAFEPDGSFIRFTSQKALAKDKGRTRSKTGSSGKPALTPTVTSFDSSHAFYRKNVVFTGRLSAFTRLEAMQRVLDSGGSCGDQVELKTHYLVIGDKDYAKLMNGLGGGSKVAKAEKLVHAGIPIMLISEEQFLTLLGS